MLEHALNRPAEYGVLFGGYPLTVRGDIEGASCREIDDVRRKGCARARPPGVRGIEAVGYPREIWLVSDLTKSGEAHADHGEPFGFAAIGETRHGTVQPLSHVGHRVLKFVVLAKVVHEPLVRSLAPNLS